MPAGQSPIARKFYDYLEYCALSERLKIEAARIHPDCVQAWGYMKGSDRTDSFIGITDISTWIFYMAPCAGVNANHPNIRALDHLHAKVRMQRVASGEFPDDTPVMFGNTASASGKFAQDELPKSRLEGMYGAGSRAICYVLLDEEQYLGSNFDGKSHQACFYWAKAKYNLGFNIFSDSLLGWAIQKDNNGYFLRFASSLNECWGQGFVNPDGTRSGQKTFTDRITRPERKHVSPADPTVKKDLALGFRKEARDLPKTWAQFFERVVGRDLNLTLLKQHDSSSLAPKQPNDRFDRMTARDEGKTTKLRRFQH
jgi:hypothetical protein